MNIEQLDLLEKLLTETPGIPAKKIARELGMTRKEVNAHLYRSPLKYIKDEQHGWALR